MKTNYIICKENNKQKFIDLGFNNFCELEEMQLESIIYFDFETTGLFAKKDDVFCCQISNGIDSNYLIVLYDENYSFYDVIPYIKDKIICGHNILFDLGFMYKYNFYPKQVLDTMLASKILYNGQFGIRHDLGAVFKKELDIYLNKAEQKFIHLIKLSQKSTIDYSFLDVNELKELHDTLKAKIIEGGFEETYNLHCRYIRALAYMEQCGLAISSKAWKAKMEEDEKNVLKYQSEINEYIFDKLPKFRDAQIDMFNTEKKIKISLTSPLQMVKVFNELGIPTKDKDGKDSIGEDIISKSKHEFVKLWLNFQEANHRVSTFGKSIYDKILDERIYTNFNPMVDTARLSCRKGSINFLNFPRDKETRQCFVANPGNVMIVCDYSGQENVISADFTGDKAMTEAVINNADLHCMLARVLFPEVAELSDEEIMRDHKEKRQESKSPRFAMSYGGNAYTIHVNEGIPMERATEIENNYKELHSGIYEWGEKVLEQAIKDGYISSVAGWRLYLPKFDIFSKLHSNIQSISRQEWGIYKEGKLEYKRKQANPDYIIKKEHSYNYYKSNKTNVSNYFKLKSEYSRLSLNSPIQTCGAHQIKLATCLMFEWIERNNLLGKVLIDNSIYDELVLECEEHLAEVTCKALSKYMQEGGNYFLTKLKIQADAHSGESWYKAK